MARAAEKRGPGSKLGLCLKRAATFLYGPADLPDEVDPLTKTDEQLGLDPNPMPPPKRSERQEAYDNLPRSDHE